MKLKVPDWKSAWFDHHISDRFFQEMSKLEKGSVGGLETSAHWMEQVMIDVGHLAQAMIRLESKDAPDPQIRQAFEKAMRLSALSLQLGTALDELARVHSGGWSAGVSPAAEGSSQASNPNAYHSYGLPGMGGMAGPAKPESEPKGGENGAQPADGNKGNLARIGGASPTLNRVTSLPPLQHRVERPPAPIKEKPVDEFTDEDFKPSTLYSSLIDMGGSGTPAEPSQMRQTIENLAQQGLSRAEIEIITGEPRHIIEAVLDHRKKA